MATQAQLTRRSTTTGTIPAATSLAGGTVTTDVTNTDHLVYTGTDDLDALMNPLVLGGLEGSLWIYVASAAVKLARVLGVVNTTGTTWVIQLDRAMAGVSGAAAGFVVADLKNYSVTNDGGTDGTFDYVVLKNGETIENSIMNRFSYLTMEAKSFDATGTSFLITEFK